MSMRLNICLTFLIPVGALAHVYRVPQEAPTIQAGLDSLQDHDTVLVALGTYAEALVAPPLHFVLRGDVVPDTGDYPRPIIDPTPLPGSDTLACLILPLESHPVIEDLMFRNGAAMYPHVYNGGGIRCYSPDPVLRRVAMDSVVWAFEHISSNLSAVATLTSCRITHASDRGVWADWAVEATDCYFAQNGATLLHCWHHSRIVRCRFDRDGLQPEEVAIVTGYEDVRIENCDIKGGILLYAPRTDVLVAENAFRWESPGTPLSVMYDGGPGSNTVTITDNLFHANAAASIVFEPYPYSEIPRLAMIGGNRFEFAGNSAIVFYDAAEIIDNRFFHSNSHASPAIHLISTTSVDTAVHLRNNLFYDTGIALRNDVAPSIDARWNWWGDSTGPYHAEQNPFGHGDTIAGNVDFIPWYPDTSFLLSAPGIGKPLPKEFVFEAYPNPFNSSVHLTLIPSEVDIVKVELFDILGRRVEELWRGPLAFQTEIAFDASGLASGIYLARVTDVLSRKNLAAAKLVLLK